MFSQNFYNITNGFLIFVRNVTTAKYINESSSFYKGPWTCKVTQYADPSGPSDFTSPWTFAKTTTLIHILRQCTSEVGPDVSLQVNWGYIIELT